MSKIVAMRWAAVLLVFAAVAAPQTARAQAAPGSVDSAASAPTPAELPRLNLNVIRGNGPTSALHLVILLGLASLAPALILTCTCWVRFVVVFSFLRSGLGTQSAPPSQVLVGLSLFMTMFVMAPVFARINEEALQPYLSGTLNEQQALALGTPPLRTFLLERTRPHDLELFYEVSSATRPDTPDDVPMRIAVPSFVVSELGTAFRMGLVVLLPFLVIELVVAALLSALGMIMLPPPIVALPIKILIFVLVDGWHLVVGSLLRGVM